MLALNGLSLLWAQEVAHLLLRTLAWATVGSW